MKQIIVYLAVFSACYASALRNGGPNHHLLSGEFLQKMRELDDQRRLAVDQQELHSELIAAAVEVNKPSQDLPPFMRSLEEETDDDYNFVGGGDQDEAIDLTGFALKYIGCQNIHQFDDEQAESGNSPLRMNQFVMLRLCPRSSCSAYNSVGCNYNFGEYTLPLGDYLKIMSKYHVRQFGQYCSTCQSCMAFEVPDNYGDDVYGDDVANDDANTDDANAGGYNYYSNYGNRKLYNYGYNNAYDQYSNQNYNQYGYYAYNYGEQSNYQYQNAYPWYIDANGQCRFEKICSGYSQACRSYSENQSNYFNYFSCQASVVANQNVYTGPHCRSDGETIGIGIYDDENCNTYIGDDLSVSNGQGDSSGAVSFGDSDLKAYYDGTCISCAASDGYSLVTDDAYGNQEYTYPLCNVLYEYSAKCNKRISIEDTYDDEEASQAETEELVCGFISNLVQKNYNEYGEIFLGNFQLSNLMHPGEYHNIIERASTWQVATVVISASTFFGLLFYSCYLHRRLTRRRKWEPSRPGLVAPWHVGNWSGQISRQNSGIGTTRSVDSVAAEAQIQGTFEGQAGGAFA